MFHHLEFSASTHRDVLDENRAKLESLHELFQSGRTYFSCDFEDTLDVLTNDHLRYDQSGIVFETSTNFILMKFGIFTISISSG